MNRFEPVNQDQPYFAGAVRHGRQFLSPGSDNIKTLAATLAAYESARSNAVVAPDLTP